MAFRSDVWFLPVARDIEADLLWDSPSRASFGKVGSIMERLRVPIDRHADGQLTEVLRKIVLVVPYRRLCCSCRRGHRVSLALRMESCCMCSRQQLARSELATSRRIRGEKVMLAIA